MAEQINWGVLGNATIARKCVIPAIQKSNNGRVNALGTRSPAAAEKTARQFDIPRVYDGYEALLADSTIDAVYLPLPNHLHLPWTLNALAASKHVLCEKPLALNAAEAERMAEAAKDADRLLMEALMYRFHPRSREIKRRITGGEIGVARMVRAAFCFHIDREIYESADNIRLKPGTGGGSLLDTGCYCVSAARWYLGAEPTAVQAQAIYHPSGVDCHLAGLLRFGDDALATIEASFISTLQQTCTIVGSEAAIELPHDAFIPWEKDACYVVRKQSEETGATRTVAGADEYRLMVEHFARAAMRRAKPACPPEDSVGNMRVLDALALAAKTGKRIDLQAT
jgi:predicted dehydrogenase